MHGGEVWAPEGEEFRGRAPEGPDLHGRDWDTFEAFKADLEGYIHHWNHVRRQVKLKGLTPVEFREQALREAA